MTGYIDKDGKAVPMPSMDFYNDTKAATRYRENWIKEQEALGRKIIP